MGITCRISAINSINNRYTLSSSPMTKAQADKKESKRDYTAYLSTIT
jgi:hypothetical protein